MAFDPNSPQAFFNDPNNLSPSYVNDPTQSSTKLADLQAAQKWLAANPNFQDANYYNSQLASALTEQNNISTYLGGTANSTAATSGLQDVQDRIQYYSGTGGLEQFKQWLKDTGNYDPSSGGNNAHNSQAYTDANNQWNQQVKDFQSQINSPQNPINKNNVIQGMTFAQPNWDAANRNVNSAFEGLNKSYLQPQLQDIYATAFNNKMGLTEKLNMAGLGQSGARQKTESGVDSDAFKKSFSDITNFNNTKAQAHQDLSQQQQQQQNQYKTGLDSLKSNDIGSLLGGAANAYGNSYNNNTSAITQKEMNDAQSALQKQQSSDSFLNGLGGAIGGLAGTAAGTALGRKI